MEEDPTVENYIKRCYCWHGRSQTHLLGKPSPCVFRLFPWHLMLVTVGDGLLGQVGLWAEYDHSYNMEQHWKNFSVEDLGCLDSFTESRWCFWVWRVCDCMISLYLLRCWCLMWTKSEALRMNKGWKKNLCFSGLLPQAGWTENKLGAWSKKWCE